MERRRQIRLVDENGNPLGARLDEALSSLLPRFQREFPAFRDEALIMDALEAAGRKIAKRERESGPIENLHGYAWVALRSVGVSWSRLGSRRLARNTLDSENSAAALGSVPAKSGTPDQIESSLFLAEVLARLTSEERQVCVWKKAGFSSQEIAEHRGTSAGAIDVLFTRTKQKIRKLFADRRPGDVRQRDSVERLERGIEPPLQHTADAEGPDDE
jgi:DNA-directed RNA polymerase specialized sigma24 family protein